MPLVRASEAPANLSSISRGFRRRTLNAPAVSLALPVPHIASLNLS